MMLGVYASAVAAEVLATVSSPNRAISVAVQLADGGRLAYEVQRNAPLIAASRLGFRWPMRRRWTTVFRWPRRRCPSMTIPEQPWGERRYVRNHYKELQELVKTLDNRRMALVFRVFDDGVGFRYEFPSSRSCRKRISDELTEFAVATGVRVVATGRRASGAGICDPQITAE
jgi:alpha-glucosidase